MENRLSLHGLNLSRPEGFHVMDEAEWSKLRVLEQGEGAGLSDPERHMIITLGYKQTGVFSAALLNTKDLAKNMEKQIHKPMTALGYQLESWKTCTISGREAEGFRYSYTVQNVGMTAESYVIKDKKEIYYLHAYMRTELLAASDPVWKAMLDAAVLE